MVKNVQRGWKKVRDLNGRLRVLGNKKPLLFNTLSHETSMAGMG